MTVLRIVCQNCQCDNVWFFDDEKSEDYERYRKFAAEHNEMHKDRPKQHDFLVSRLRDRGGGAGVA